MVISQHEVIPELTMVISQYEVIPELTMVISLLVLGTLNGDIMSYIFGHFSPILMSPYAYSTSHILF